MHAAFSGIGTLVLQGPCVNTKPIGILDRKSAAIISVHSHVVIEVSLSGRPVRLIALCWTEEVKLNMKVRMEA